MLTSKASTNFKNKLVRSLKDQLWSRFSRFHFKTNYIKIALTNFRTFCLILPRPLTLQNKRAKNNSANIKCKSNSKSQTLKTNCRTIQIKLTSYKRTIFT